MFSPDHPLSQPQSVALQSRLRDRAEGDLEASIQRVRGYLWREVLPLCRSAYLASGMDFGAPDHPPDGFGEHNPVQRLEVLALWPATPLPLRADFSRQLHVWDEDLCPLEGDLLAYLWLIEASELLLFAALGLEHPRLYEARWTRAQCVGVAAACGYLAAGAFGEEPEIRFRAALASMELSP